MRGEIERILPTDREGFCQAFENSKGPQSPVDGDLLAEFKIAESSQPLSVAEQARNAKISQQIRAESKLQTLVVSGVKYELARERLGMAEDESIKNPEDALAEEARIKQQAKYEEALLSGKSYQEARVISGYGRDRVLDCMRRDDSRETEDNRYLAVVKFLVGLGFRLDYAFREAHSYSVFSSPEQK